MCDKKSTCQIEQLKKLVISPEKDPFGELLKQHTLYSNIQVNADTIYYNRTSIITLTQGLMFVAFNALVDHKDWLLANIAIAALGFLLSAFWIFFEQRNLIFFKGRAAVLRKTEIKLIKMASEEELHFQPFWTEVPNWVKNNAKWYQKISAQNVLRLWIPLMFVIAWFFLGTFCLSHLPDTDKQQKPALNAPLSKTATLKPVTNQKANGSKP